MKVLIIDIPPGEAPEEVRRAWVGLELPVVAGHAHLHTTRVSGVLTGPKTFWGRLRLQFSRSAETLTGYAVDGRTAVAILAVQHPEAAAWWRHYAPHVLQPGGTLLFAEQLCLTLPD